VHLDRPGAAPEHDLAWHHAAGHALEAWSMHKATLNRVQALVLSFLSLAWLSLIGVLAVAPEIYDRTLQVPSDGNARLAELLFLGAVSALILIIAIGVVLRWRWIFWLLLIAFLSGVLRVPASMLELAGWIPASGPIWYVVFQAVIGIVQFAIGLVLLIEYRHYGVWGRAT
jgi:hypothetical protein